MGTHTITAKIINSRQTCIGSFPFEYRDEREEFFKKTRSSSKRKKKTGSNQSPRERKPTVRTSAL